MKQLALFFFFLMSSQLFAQKPCELSDDITDSIGTYKSTKEYMIYEKNFGGNSNYIFFSLALTDGTPTLKIQIIQKSKESTKSNCFDKSSKIYLQLNNGKIITLLHTDNVDCGTTMRDDKGVNNRYLSGSFLFIKGSLEELKSSSINMIRVKYLTDSEDYVMKKGFTAELDSIFYEPETYFVNYLHCIDGESVQDSKQESKKDSKKSRR